MIAVLKGLVVRILALLLLYSLLRVVFLLSNADLLGQQSVWDIGFSLIHGLRFDASAIVLLNIPYILLSLVPYMHRFPLWQGFLGSWFVVSNGLFLAGNTFDIEYFKFTGKRLTASSFMIVGDMETHLGPIALDYWYFSLLIIAMFSVLLIINRRFPLVIAPPLKRWYALPALLVFLIVAGVLGRGGWQAKPLIPANAFFGQSPFLAQLSLNSSFTFLKSLNQPPLERLSYFSDWPAIESKIKPFLSADHNPKMNLPPDTNVIILILESFNLEYTGISPATESFTPFLNQLAKQGVFYRNHFANGRRSIDALPSIFTGIPSWMPKPLITSPFQANRLTALPRILADNGYQTAFFHGGEDGTMFFDVMAKRFGFQQYFGANSYPNSGDHDGRWGIYDEPFLKFTGHTLDTFKEPFFAGVFTLSSQHPYRIPEKYQGRFHKGDLEIHESIGYTDYALQEFFRGIQSKPWFKNTLFVITADHTSKSTTPYFNSEQGIFRVPLVLYHPSMSLAALSEQDLAQHIDIFPTILDLLALPYPNKMPRFGLSLLNHENRHVILNIGDKFNLITESAQYSIQPSLELATNSHTASSDGPDDRLWRSLLKAKIQYYYNGMLDDRLIW